ncbi:MAG: glycosyltransferase [Bacteroidetes bacterium]|jgi:glycosyltransferase involved in cell wall biosynthesis|nr:glycosyltransferase [Bacteroidota bacterium]
MKILQLCKKFPYPLKDGESIAVTSLSRSLRRLGCEISLLAMNTRKHYFPVDQLPPHFNHYKTVRTVAIDNRVKPWAAFKSLMSEGDSYHISRFLSADYERQLKTMLQANDYDIVQLETPYLSPYIPVVRRCSDAAVVMRAHNVEHEIWERISANTRFGPKRWYLNKLTERLRRYEIQQLGAYDLLAAITERDLAYFRKMGYDGKATVTPIGIESSRYEPDFTSYEQPLSLSFIGSLDWMPNQEGLRWFLEHVWPALQQRHPGLKLHVAGRNTPSWLYRLNMRGLQVEGEVPSAADFINQHSLMVVPLLSGSGMRAKILEGMALGKAVLTTSIGLEGIAAGHRKEVLVADTPKAFVDEVSWAIKEQTQLCQLGKAARQLVLERYDSLEVARRLMKAYSELTVEAL